MPTRMIGRPSLLIIATIYAQDALVKPIGQCSKRCVVFGDAVKEAGHGSLPKAALGFDENYQTTAEKNSPVGAGVR